MSDVSGRRPSPVARRAFGREHREVHGGDGTPLAVWETGRRGGPALVLVHGLGYAAPVWSKQFDSSLADDFHLVAFDLRGHGRSGKPEVGYDRSEVWAQDLRAVLDAHGGERPVVVAWSYGGLVLLDHLRVHGEGDIAGVVLVGAANRIGTDGWRQDLGLPASATADTLLPQSPLPSSEAVDGMTALPLPYDEHCLWLGMTACAPLHARAAMLRRCLENDDVLAGLTVPVSIVHGREDRSIRVDAAARVATLVRHAEVSVVDGVGHAPFWEGPEAFNATLRSFATRCLGQPPGARSS